MYYFYCGILFLNILHQILLFTILLCIVFLRLKYFFLNLFYFIFYFILFLAVLGLHCCTRAFSSCGERGLLFVAVRRLLIAVASLIVEHGL